MTFETDKKIYRFRILEFQYQAAFRPHGTDTFYKEELLHNEEPYPEFKPPQRAKKNLILPIIIVLVVLAIMAVLWLGLL